MSAAFDPVDAARKIIQRADERPEVRSVQVGVGGLVAICKALLDRERQLKERADR